MRKVRGCSSRRHRPPACVRLLQVPGLLDLLAPVTPQPLLAAQAWLAAKPAAAVLPAASLAGLLWRRAGRRHVGGALRQPHHKQRHSAAYRQKRAACGRNAGAACASEMAVRCR